MGGQSPLSHTFRSHCQVLVIVIGESEGSILVAQLFRAHKACRGPNGEVKQVAHRGDFTDKIGKLFEDYREARVGIRRGSRQVGARGRVAHGSRSPNEISSRCRLLNPVTIQLIDCLLVRDYRFPYDIALRLGTRPATANI